MKKRLLIVSTLIVISGAIAWIFLWMQAPAEGTVSQPPTQWNKSSATYSKKLDGTYISFMHSSEYTASRDAPINSDLERHTLNASTHYNKQILASVASLPGGQLKSNGDYIYRQKSPEKYAGRKIEVNGKLIDIWVKKDGTEQTAMIARGDKAAVLSIVSAPGANIDLTAEMNKLINTLEWKK